MKRSEPSPEEDSVIELMFEPGIAEIVTGYTIKLHHFRSNRIQINVCQTVDQRIAVVNDDALEPL